MSSSQQIEQQLITGLRRIEAPYQQALTILDQAPSGESGNRLPVSEHLKLSERLKPSMQVIAECEEQLQPIREQWHNLNVDPGHELQELLSKQADLLKRLIGRLNDAEADMKASQSDIGSRLDESRTHVAMRQAYQTESA